MDGQTTVMQRQQLVFEITQVKFRSLFTYIHINISDVISLLEKKFSIHNHLRKMHINTTMSKRF